MGRWRRTSPWERANRCDRVRQLISLRLDGELSELEEAALDRHLEGCPRCLALSTRVGDFTSLLREQPLLELPRPVAVTVPRSQRARVARRGGVVLAFAAAIGAVAALAVLPRGPAQTTSALS